MPTVFTDGPWVLLNSRAHMMTFLRAVAESFVDTQLVSGELYGTYTAREKRQPHPRPLTVIDALYAAGSDTPTATKPFDVKTNLLQLVASHTAPDTELWPLQVMVLGCLYLSKDCRKKLAKHAPVQITAWIQNLPERLEHAVLGKHEGKGSPLIQSISAAHFTVKEILALKHAYESGQCV